MCVCVCVLCLCVTMREIDKCQHPPPQPQPASTRSCPVRAPSQSSRVASRGGTNNTSSRRPFGCLTMSNAESPFRACG